MLTAMFFLLFLVNGALALRVSVREKVSRSDTYFLIGYITLQTISYMMIEVVNK